MGAVVVVDGGVARRWVFQSSQRWFARVRLELKILWPTAGRGRTAQSGVDQSARWLVSVFVIITSPN